MILVNEIISYLIDSGMTEEAAAGIYGNLYAESSCRTTVRNDADKTIGIAGFTGAAYDNYLTYAESTKRAWDDLFCQLDYLIKSAKNRFAWQNHVDGDESNQYGSVTNARRCGYTISLVSWDAFIRSTNIGQTASCFLAIYEDCLYERTALYYNRPSLASWVQEQITNRCVFAEQAYKEYKQMSSNTFSNPRQDDPQWANTAFGDGGETWASSACGVFAISSILGFKTFDKINEVYKWLKSRGYVTDHSGTWQPGIYKCLNYFGVESSQMTDKSKAGKTDFAELTEFINWLKSGKTGIILFGGTSTGCVSNQFTGGGHYVAVVKWKEGYLYLMDPAGRNTGWIPISQIRGNVKHLFKCAKRWKAEEAEGMTVFPELKLGMSGTAVYVGQTLLRGRGFKGKDGKALSLDSQCGNNTIYARDKYCSDRKIKTSEFWKDITGGLCR